MSIMIVPDLMTSKLAAAESPITLCTAAGQVLGLFTPDKTVKLNLDPGISEEELDRREAAGGGRPLADILRDLEGRK